MTAHTDSKNPSVRRVSRGIKGMPASDGAGVKLTRVIGQPALPMLDPFLLLDAFRSDQPEDYLAGFPPHPHRGFETVTYLLDGRLRHQDSAGHEGVIESSGVQWMNAGSKRITWLLQSFR
jgi:redox-sensitive bicupin YhaK (pirin superfamily)